MSSQPHSLHHYVRRVFSVLRRVPNQAQVTGRRPRFQGVVTDNSGAGSWARKS